MVQGVVMATLLACEETVREVVFAAKMSIEEGEPAERHGSW